MGAPAGAERGMGSPRAAAYAPKALRRALAVAFGGGGTALGGPAGRSPPVTFDERTENRAGACCQHAPGHPGRAAEQDRVLRELAQHVRVARGHDWVGTSLGRPELSPG